MQSKVIHRTSLKANSHSAGHEIVFILWDPQVKYRVRKSSQLHPNLISINQTHILTAYFSKTHFNNILKARFSSTEWFFLPFRFSY
jgi:hypothetical protein